MNLMSYSENVSINIKNNSSLIIWKFIPDILNFMICFCLINCYLLRSHTMQDKLLYNLIDFLVLLVLLCIPINIFMNSTTFWAILGVLLLIFVETNRLKSHKPYGKQEIKSTMYISLSMIFAMVGGMLLNKCVKDPLIKEIIPIILQNYIILLIIPILLIIIHFNSEWLNAICI